MSSQTETTTQHWASAIGAQVADRRAAREAQRQADGEGPPRLPAEVLEHRFAQVMRSVIESLRAFEDAAGIAIGDDPGAGLAVTLHACDRAEQLALSRQRGDVIALFNSTSRKETQRLDLAGADFDPDPLARLVAEEFIRRIIRREEACHA